MVPKKVIKLYFYRYYEYLELANEGDVRPFVRFIAECTEKTLDMFIRATKEYISSIPALDDESKTITLETTDIILENETTDLNLRKTDKIKSFNAKDEVFLS